MSRGPGSARRVGGTPLPCPIVTPDEAMSSAEAWLPHGARSSDEGASDRRGPVPASNGTSSGGPLGGETSPDPAQWLPPGAEPLESPTFSQSPETDASRGWQTQIPDLDDPTQLVEIQKTEIAVLVRRIEELERELAAARKQS